LRTLSGLFRSVFRETDVVCRFGGDEFAVILAGADLETARKRADGFRHTVEEQELRFGDNCSSRLTISIGLATWACSDRLDSEAAIPTSILESAPWLRARVADGDGLQTGLPADEGVAEAPVDWPSQPAN
jgi:GGDEF domain-containing protein